MINSTKNILVSCIFTGVVLQYGELIQENCALFGESVKIGTKVAFCMLINLWARANCISVCKSNMAAKFKIATAITVNWLIARAVYL